MSLTTGEQATMSLTYDERNEREWNITCTVKGGIRDLHEQLNKLIFNPRKGIKEEVDMERRRIYVRFVHMTGTKEDHIRAVEENEAWLSMPNSEREYVSIPQVLMAIHELQQKFLEHLISEVMSK